MADHLMLLLLVFVTSVSISHSLSQEGKQYCWRDPHTNQTRFKFIVWPNDDTVIRVYSVAMPNCTLNNNGSTFELTFDPDTECGTTVDGSGGYSIQFKTVGSDLFLLGTDLIFNLYCAIANFTTLPSESMNNNQQNPIDFTNSTGNTSTSQITITSVNSNIGSIPFPQLQVLDLNANNQWEFAEQVVMRITLSSIDVIRGVRISNCQAAPTGAFDPDSTISLITNGCPNIIEGIYNVSQNGTGFTEDATRNVTLEPFAIVSEPFLLFKFVHTTTVMFKCAYQYCYTNASECLTSCASSGRRRRSVGSLQEDDEIKELFAVIDFNTAPAGPLTNTIVRTVSRDPVIKLQSCPSTDAYIGIISALGVILLIALATSTYTCLKITGRSCNRKPHRLTSVPLPDY